MPIIKKIDDCLKLQSRSKKHYGKKINQNCSRKCQNAIKKGKYYNSYSETPKHKLDIREKPKICGFTVKHTLAGGRHLSASKKTSKKKLKRLKRASMLRDKNRKKTLKNLKWGDFKKK